MTLSLEEVSEVIGVNASRVVFVDGSEGGHGRVVKSEFEATLQGIESTLQVDFLLNDLTEGSLNVVSKAVESSDIVGTAVKSDISQVVISAWKNELQETKDKVKCQIRFIGRRNKIKLISIFAVL